MRIVQRIGAAGEAAAGGTPSAHAASHKAGGSDALLAAPGPIGGDTPNTIDATTVTADEFIGDGSQLTNLPGGGGDGPPHAARLTMAFEGGGTIAAWQGYPLIATGSVSYAPYGGTRAEGAADFAVLIAKGAGTYTVSFVYDADDDIKVAVRVKPSGGAYSRLRYETLSLNDNSASFNVDLPAGGSLSLHYAPASGGSVTLTYWEVWL